MGFWLIPNTGVSADTPISEFPGNLPASRLSGQKRAVVIAPRTTSYPLTHEYALMSLFNKKMFIPEAGLAMISWQIDTQHNGVNGHAVQIEGMSVYRMADTEAELTGQSFQTITSAYDQGVIRDVTHHYYTIHFNRYPFKVLPNKWYEFSLNLRARSTVSGTLNGLATMQNNGGTQYMSVEYEPGAVLEV